MGIGERLRAERTRLQWTQEQLARLGGVTVQSQRMYESDKRSPNAVYLNQISGAGIDIQYVITGHRSVNQRTIYKEPTDALTVVVDLQDEFGRFDADQIKSLIGFAWTYQVGKEGLREFIRSAYEMAGIDQNKQDSTGKGDSAGEVE